MIKKTQRSIPGAGDTLDSGPLHGEPQMLQNLLPTLLLLVREQDHERSHLHLCLPEWHRANRTVMYILFTGQFQVAAMFSGDHSLYLVVFYTLLLMVNDENKCYC